MKAGIYKFKARASVDGETRRRGRADVHDAQGRLSTARRDDMAQIHPTAIVDPKAELDAVGRGRALCGDRPARAHRRTALDRCALRDRGPHHDRRATTASSSSPRSAAPPQDKKYAGEPTRLEIGDRNTIREFCTFNTGTAQDAGVTRVGDDNWIMAYVHIAHDCQVGSHTILANNGSWPAMCTSATG